jgi:hypothetical protein
MRLYPVLPGIDVGIRQIHKGINKRLRRTLQRIDVRLPFRPVPVAAAGMRGCLPIHQRGKIIARRRPGAFPRVAARMLSCKGINR